MPRKFTGDTLVLATHNQKKIDEMRGLLAGRVKTILTARDLSLPEPAETGTTFLENATLKAVAAARACRYPTLSDDSGLCIAALNGAPGVYTADWAGHPRNWAMMNQRILQTMQGASDRRAYFQAVIVVAWPDGHIEATEGRIDGHIVDAPRGTLGFGADPIFMLNGYAKTFGEMTAAEKIAVSHRSQAVKAMIEKCFSA